MKNKYIKLALKIIILLIGFYIGYKCYYLYKYSISSRTINNYDNFKSFISNAENLNLNTKIEENVNYLEFNNIKIRNDWENTLELIEDTTYSHKYVSYDELGNMLYSIWLGGPEENFIDVFIEDSTSADGGSYKKYYEENNIYDLISLLKYLNENKDTKSGLFTSLRKIEWLYTMNAVPSTLFEYASDLKFIDGSYRGVMYTYDTNNQKSILINKDGKTYGISFFGLDYFTDEYIYDLLETVIIE